MPSGGIHTHVCPTLYDFLYTLMLHQQNEESQKFVAYLLFKKVAIDYIDIYSHLFSDDFCQFCRRIRDEFNDDLMEQLEMLTHQCKTFDTMIRIKNYIIELDPTNLSNLNWLGWLYHLKGDYWNTVRIFKKVALLCPEGSELQEQYYYSFKDLGLSYVKLELYESAREIAMKLKKIYDEGDCEHILYKLYKRLHVKKLAKWMHKVYRKKQKKVGTKIISPKRKKLQYLWWRLRRSLTLKKKKKEKGRRQENV